MHSAVLYAPMKCSNCSGLSVARTDTHIESHLHEASLADPVEFWRFRDPDTWEPKWVEGQAFPDVPDHIGRAASEAHKSNSIENFMSAILMARTVIEASAKEKGITSGRLVQKIDAMRAADLIREDTKDAAHEIREFGNDMAHGDIAVQVNAEDAAEILALMDEILQEVFQGPARTARVRQRRVERENQTP
ncbi:DUF4145 domain-containing protein [Citricoccus sp. K5]|uniref:DUF4145 domain-containing protein n=1 Tax=Citricoccus sp. K5 TaxID=2653135 RepID=UPI001916232E|nr:DUF4145 domain-containing protein [Citricoccus sp. K5]